MRQFRLKVTVAPLATEGPVATGITGLAKGPLALGGLPIEDEGDVHFVMIDVDANNDFEARQRAAAQVEELLQLLALYPAPYHIVNCEVVAAGPKVPTSGMVVRITPSIRDDLRLGAPALRLQDRALALRAKWSPRIERALELHYYASISPNAENEYLLLVIALDSLAPSMPRGNVLADNLSKVARDAVLQTIRWLLVAAGLSAEMIQRVVDHASQTETTSRTKQVHNYLDGLGIGAMNHSDVRVCWKIRGSLAHGALPPELQADFDNTLPRLRTATQESLKLELGKL